MFWQCNSYTFDTRMPIIMGILNVTPDSFSDGGLYVDLDAALAHAHQMRDEGALIIDVGGESTRPGSVEVSREEELRRCLPVVKALAEEGLCVSIDTRHVEVARACVEAGASIINDVSGFRDPAMVELAASCKAGLVVMHMQGVPKTMQEAPQYTDVVQEVGSYLKQRAHELETAGVERNRICIDPGPGFGKTAEQTYDLVRNMHEFARLGYPVMVALSRKSFLGVYYGIDTPAERDQVSAQENLRACELGASIIRTHNVAATAKALKDLRPYAFIALGSNVALVANPGEERRAKVDQIHLALADMCKLDDTDIIDLSRLYESEPAYVTDQDSFVNAVCLIRTGLPPRTLLQYLQIIEQHLGRVRHYPNGPRTIDLDILDYQNYISDDDQLSLPHPRILERDFVVSPLQDIRPHHIFSDGTALTRDAVAYGKAWPLGSRDKS